MASAGAHSPLFSHAQRGAQPARVQPPAPLRGRLGVSAASGAAAAAPPSAPRRRAAGTASQLGWGRLRHVAPAVIRHPSGARPLVDPETRRRRTTNDGTRWCWPLVVGSRGEKGDARSHRAAFLMQKTREYTSATRVRGKGRGGTRACAWGLAVGCFVHSPRFPVVSVGGAVVRRER